MKGLLVRRLAWQVLQSVSSGAYAEKAVERAFRKSNLKTSDRSLLTEISYGAIRQRYVLDCWIDFLGKVPALKQPPLLRWLLHVGLYQILCMDRVPESAAVNITVQLAKESDLNRLSRVVNAILREAVRAKEDDVDLPQPKDQSLRFAQKYSLPIWLSKKIISWRGLQDAENIAKAFNQSPTIDLRVNRLRSNPTNLQEEFKIAGLKTKPINGCPFGIEICSNPGNIRELPGYEQGDWSVQDRSAQWVSPFLAPSTEDKILDVCAAPGGKTIHLAELMSGNGEIWAVDRSEDRLKRLSFNAARLGIKSIHPLVADASLLDTLKPEWNGFFNKILIDAPCSGLGTLARNPDARWRIKPENIDDLIDLQYRILNGVLPLLAYGGRIVYSTCTINPSENFEQIKNLVQSHPDLHLLKEEQRWPGIDREGDGFYVAILEREFY